MWGCTKGMQHCLRGNRLTLSLGVRRKRRRYAPNCRSSLTG
nr:MAG TPA: hypothetical protein [Caudoviricetes sp.]